MIVLVLLVVRALAAEPPSAVLSADAVVEAALARSLDLAEAVATVGRAEGARRAECGPRHDPTVDASAALVGDAWSVSLTQPLSATGAGLAACAAAGHARDAARAHLDRARLEVAAWARRAFVDAVAATSQEDLAAQALDVARRIEEAARGRAAVGEASQLDLKLAVLQVERARSGWMTAAVTEGRALAELSTLTGVGVDEIVLPDDPLDGAPGPRASGAATRSDIVASRAEVEAARAALARERADVLPPVELGVFVEEEGPELRAGPAVSVTLPLWRGNVDGRARAGADLAVARARAEAAERRADAEQAAAGRSVDALEAALIDQPADLPQQARAALESVALGYDRGELDLLSTSLLRAEIIEGHRAWIEGRRVVAGARIDRMLAEEDAEGSRPGR